MTPPMPTPPGTQDDELVPVGDENRSQRRKPIERKRGEGADLAAPAVTDEANEEASDENAEKPGDEHDAHRAFIEVEGADHGGRGDARGGGIRSRRGTASGSRTRRSREKPAELCTGDQLRNVDFRWLRHDVSSLPPWLAQTPSRSAVARRRYFTTKGGIISAPGGASSSVRRSRLAPRRARFAAARPLPRHRHRRRRSAAPRGDIRPRRGIGLQRYILARRDAGGVLGERERRVESAEGIDEAVRFRVGAAPYPALGDGLDRIGAELAAGGDALLESGIDIVEHGVEPLPLGRRKILHHALDAGIRAGLDRAEIGAELLQQAAERELAGDDADGAG